MNTTSSLKHSRETSWKALGYYNFYHFLIAFLFVSLYWIGQLPQPLGVYDSVIFAITSHFYLIISIAALFFIQIRKPAFVYQVTGHVLIDIVLITLFIYSSAGLNSGFGMLMIIAIAGGCILIPGRVGFFFAAIAAIAVLGHEVYIQLSPVRPSPNYIHAGFLGMTYFLTASVSHALAAKVEASEALAEQRAVDLENLARLNDHIVQRLQSGIIVLDETLHIRLLNESTRTLLALEDDLHLIELVDVAPVLVSGIQSWLNGAGEGTFIVNRAGGGVDIQVSLSRLKFGNTSEVLVFLDDVSRLRQQAQQLKLASLGRLTASIAHEIRNPLGAISHAGQLLSESDSLAREERRLTTIINDQSVRVNNIIENVMRISRRDQAIPATINLCRWLAKFTEELVSRYQLQGSDILLTTTADDIQANMDPGQLEQIMWNICENGVRYSHGSPLLEIRSGLKQGYSGRPYIDIIDHGDGIAGEIAEQLFEPFVTTHAQGTGLGLFIARELCEANQATLGLHANTERGCCFRIEFSHPERRQRIA